MGIKSNHFNALESMRGLAALMVILFHLNSHWPGHLAVDFFFMLSGFILTHTYHFQKPDTTKRDFILARFIRLYPLHIFTLAAYTIAYLLIKSEIPAPETSLISTLAQQLTLTHNIGLNKDLGLLLWNYPSWSISVEFWVSLIFILLIGKNTPSLYLMGLSALCFIFIALNFHHLNVHYMNIYSVINMGLLRGLASFLLGIVAYRVFHRYKNLPDIKHATLYETLCIATLSLIVFLRPEPKFITDFLAPPLFFVMIILFAFEQGRLSRGLKDIRYLGTISYSIYLNQMLVILVCTFCFEKFSLSNNNMIFAILVTVIIYSHLTYRYIEYPMKSFLSKRLLPSQKEKIND